VLDKRSSWSAIGYVPPHWREGVEASTAELSRMTGWVRRRLQRSFLMQSGINLVSLSTRDSAFWRRRTKLVIDIRFALGLRSGC